MEITQEVFSNPNRNLPGWSDRDKFTCTCYKMNYKDDKNFIDACLKGVDTSNVYDVLNAFNERLGLYFFTDVSEDDKCMTTFRNPKFTQADFSMCDNITAEVRSSFVFGFPNVPLFKMNKAPQFDGHGTYNLTCGYNMKSRTNKPKDIYTMIMIPSPKETFLVDIYNEISFYVTGSATQNIIEDKGGFVKYNCTKIKENQINTNSKVVAISNSLDVEELKEKFNN